MTFMDVVNTTLVPKSADKWGHFHELGHNHQSDLWTWDCTVEVSAGPDRAAALTLHMHAIPSLSPLLSVPLCLSCSPRPCSSWAQRGPLAATRHSLLLQLPACLPACLPVACR
jgi:hypothetical protein